MINFTGLEEKSKWNGKKVKNTKRAQNMLLPTSLATGPMALKMAGVSLPLTQP